MGSEGLCATCINVEWYLEINHDSKYKHDTLTVIVKSALTHGMYLNRPDAV